MIRTVPAPLRNCIAFVFGYLTTLREAAAIKRPLSRHVVWESLDKALGELAELDELLRDYFVGTIDEDGEEWDPDDVIVLTKQTSGGDQ